MADYEKLGAFYLGRSWDQATQTLQNDLVLYDSPDLTTHAVIIGMTGSGKTGLGISLLEEAAIDRVPVIAIDPKGDLGNLLLSFPDLAPADFEPWVDAQTASAAGQTVAEFAAAQADLWRQGLASWGQAPERIARLRAAADFALYTPGSSAGLPLSVLGCFHAPAPALMADADLYRQHIQGVATGLLTLVGVEADPITSREHILLSAILDSRWQSGHDLDLPGLITAIQSPGLTRVGVLDLDTFYPAKDRFALAMRLNNLLAAPGFQAWTDGEPLDAGKLLFTADGQPRVSVLSIAHLSDAERMFFVTLLLNEIIAWMRAQPGTSSLRAILYMDEVFGYLPPVANPPSKILLLTLLKQARAFGLGVVLSTQNPVDLDYKALSNAGTWFIGRLQTEQDRNRVRDGLLAAAPVDGLDAPGLDRMIAALGKRTFLLHNVHERAPVVFQTRWAMSYLRGPLTREDIRRLVAARPATAALPAPDRGARPVARAASSHRPVAPPGIAVLYGDPGALPGPDERLVYHPRLLAAARVAYLDKRHQIDLQRDLVVALEPGDGPPDWRQAEKLAIDLGMLSKEAEPDAGFADLPAQLVDPRIIKAGQTQFRTWVRTEVPVRLLRSPALKATSAPDEDPGEFRIRLQQLAREARDRAAGALRQKYAARADSLQERLRRAEQSQERKEQQAASAKVDTALALGTSVLGALFGRKTRGVSTAVRKAGTMQRQAGDVQRAADNVEALRAQLAEIEAAAEADLQSLAVNWESAAESLEEVAIRAKATDITVQFCGIGWLPYIEDAQGNLRPA